MNIEQRKLCFFMAYASRKTFEKDVSAHIQHFYIVQSLFVDGSHSRLYNIICSHFDVLFPFKKP